MIRTNWDCFLRDGMRIDWCKTNSTISAKCAAIPTFAEHLRGTCRVFMKIGAANTNMTRFDENLTRTQDRSWGLFNANILLAVISRSAHHLVRR